MPLHSDLPHTPFDGSHPLFRIGLKPFRRADWFHADHCLEEHLAEKRRLVSEIPDKVFRMTKGTEAAQQEVLSIVGNHLIGHDAGRYCRTGDGTGVTFASAAMLPDSDIQDMPALLRAALLVQEDLVIMSRRDGFWHLAAGAVCFPSSWSLKDKAGKPMHGVHAPVPGFREGTRNAGLIERIFDNLQVEQPVERFNWSIYNTDRLFQDGRSGEHVGKDDRHFLRVERQTLTRLPESGDILFTIRIYVDPFEALKGRADRSEFARGFIGLLQGLDEEQLEYKGLVDGRARLVKRLQAMVE